MVDLFLLHQVNAFASAVPLSSANGVAIGASPQGEWLSPAKGFPYFGGSLLLVTDVHIMGLPLSITNRIRCKGVPSSEGLPEQEMGFFHRISAFKANRIRINCVTLSNENGFADQGSPPPPPSEWDSHRDGHPLSSRDFWSQKQHGEFFAYTSGQSNERHQSRKGSLLPLRIKVA